MASLPLSATATLAHLSFDGGGVVQVSSANTTPTVTSVLDNVSGLGATQAVVSQMPVRVRSPYGVAGSYSSLGFTLGSSQCLTFDNLASSLGTTWAAFVVAKTSVAATAQDFFSFAQTATLDGYVQVGVDGANHWYLSSANDGGTGYQATGGTSDLNTHVFTVLKDATLLTLRVDGAVACSFSTTSTFTPNNMTFGGLRNNSGSSRFLTGNLYEFACYAGGSNSSYVAIETFLVNKYTKGLNRVV